MKTNKALELRKEHNLLQREVAELVGCSLYSVSRAEQGGAPEVYEKILRVLGDGETGPAEEEEVPREPTTLDRLLSARWIDTKTNWRNRYNKGATA